MPPSTALILQRPSTSAGAIARLFQPPPTSIRGIDSGEWFGPGQPVKPVAPEGTEPRGMQYIPSQNLLFTPRSTEPMTAAQLREASMYDLVRVIIENTKDQICRIPWTIRRVAQPGEKRSAREKAEQTDAQLKGVNEFFRNPNIEQNYSEFTRKILDDMLVIDAAAILIRRKNGKGPVVDLRPVDGATITRYIDEQGFTPLPPDPAYAQLWYGIPMVDLNTDQLIYAPRNVPTYALYGMSPVQQAIHWIKIGTDRLAFQGAYYTEGNIPDMLQVVPRGVTPDKIKETQDAIVSDLAGVLGKRRQIRLLQGFTEEGKDQILFPKEALLTDSFDDLVIRCLCFAFGTSPQRLMRMMNRASAQANQEAAELEGLYPWLDWHAGVMNRIIQTKMGFKEYEFAHQVDRDVDPKNQAEIDTTLTSKANYTINERRELRGDDPRPEPEAAQLGIVTATGWVAIGATPQPTGEDDPNGNDPDPNKPAPKNGKEPNGPAGASKKHGARLTKYIRIEPGVLHPHSLQAQTSIKAAFAKIFAAQKTTAAREAAQLLAKRRHTRKASQKTPDEIADTIYAAIREEFDKVPDEVQSHLESAAAAGATKGLAELGIHDQGMIQTVNTQARDWAAQRAAEMVGMRRTDEDKLVPNPSASWRIDETTRNDLRSIISNAFTEETAMDSLVQEIQDAGAFSESRADMIARTEVSFAQTNGNVDAWNATGLVKSVTSALSADHDVEDDCDDNAGVIVKFGSLFPSGDFFPPFHPRCQCTLIIVELNPIE